MKRAFTLVELLVVVGMIAVLMTSIGVGISSAMRQSKIAKAKGEVNEITNAIRAYGNYVDDGIPERNDVVADESSLAFILGKGTDRAGQTLPVLYNAALRGGKMMDPWGRPYRVTIKAVEDDAGNGDDVATSMTGGIYIPNRYGRSAEGSK